jgi:hypothetical protein
MALSKSEASTEIDRARMELEIMFAKPPDRGVMDRRTVEKMKNAFRTIEKDRQRADFVWRYTQSDPYDSFHEKWGTLMARSLLRAVNHVPNSKQTSPIAKLTYTLFKVREVGDLEDLPVEQEFSGTKHEVAEKHAKVIMSVGCASIFFMNYLEIGAGSTMRGLDKATVEARRVVCMTAFLFLALHYDLSFLMHVMYSKEVRLADMEGFKNFACTNLNSATGRLLNGITTDINLYLTDCICSFIEHSSLDCYAHLPEDVLPPHEPAAKRKRRNVTTSVENGKSGTKRTRTDKLIGTDLATLEPVDTPTRTSFNKKK